MEEVCLAVDRCLENRRIRNRLDAFQEAQRRESEDIRIVGQCPEIVQVLSIAQKIAALPADPGGGLVTTLILGETGTGKGVVARLHPPPLPAAGSSIRPGELHRDSREPVRSRVVRP